jgi:hypothetical protein
VLHAILEDCWATADKVGKKWSSLSEELAMEWGQHWQFLIPLTVGLKFASVIY